MEKLIISEKELAVLAKHEGIKEIVAEVHGMKPTNTPRFITYYLVRVNGHLLYRESAVREGDNLQTLARLVGVNHGPLKKADCTNPFEFESVEKIADLLFLLQIKQFSIDSYVRWTTVNIDPW